MNIKDHFPELGIDANTLTDKKQQTGKKIQYVSEYVRHWAYVMLKRDNVDTLDFIDCMSNAGVYKDGDYCTAIEVLMIFTDLADANPNKTFRVFCNDNDQQKLEILDKICRSDLIPNKKNVHVVISHMDVNSYLEILSGNPKVRGKTNLFAYGTSTILYVDPFDFGTVEIPKVSKVLKNHYCELIFNFFISDYVRNIAKDKGRITNCLGGNSISTKEELIDYIRSQFRVGHIKYLFAYQFKTKTNVELYQIIFATPSLRGLEKLKEVLWKVFNGAEFHRNKVESDQFCLFTPEDDELQVLATYSAEAQELLAMEFSKQIVTWDEIERVLIERTMLKETQIIKHVLKPMIEDNRILKRNINGKANYKSDYFEFLV